MIRSRMILFALLAGASTAAGAQFTTPARNGDMTIIVTGAKPRNGT